MKMRIPFAALLNLDAAAETKEIAAGFPNELS